MISLFVVDCMFDKGYLNESFLRMLLDLKTEEGDARKKCDSRDITKNMCWQSVNAFIVEL